MVYDMYIDKRKNMVDNMIDKITLINAAFYGKENTQFCIKNFNSLHKKA